MSLATAAVRGVVRHFTTDQAVRAGVVTAAWSAAASYARGLLPRTPVQQAAATGATVASHYAIGATLWSGITRTAAGVPGARAGNRALLTAAVITAAGGKAAELQLRPYSGESLLYGTAWSTAKMLSVVGLAGGLVTASDVIAHEFLDLPRTPTTTLALDLTTGSLMASGTWVRRRRRAKRFKDGSPGHHTVARSSQKAGNAGAKTLLHRAKTGTYVAAAVSGTSVGLGVLAVAEQAAARRVTDGLDALVGEDLGDLGVAAGHGATFGAFALAGYLGLRGMRQRIERRSVDIEPAYQQPPNSRFVSAGPLSAVDFAAIGKEGRRFVLMRLSEAEIEEVMAEPAVEPVRVVVPRTGTISGRARLAVSELVATGGIDRSLICIASPTGVGYVNYVMAEALEYLTRGDCAIVVPQYAYVPSALALNKTDEGTDLQEAVIRAVRAEASRRNPAARIVQFGESLGAQVAADVGGVRGVGAFDAAGLTAGLYLGVPFRSSLWRAYLRDPVAMTRGGRLAVVSQSGELTDEPGRHVLLIHHDDPITKFAYSMVVQRPWWMGPPKTRPPNVPRETYFRPITTFVLAMVDVLNGMNMKPGQFRRVGHDYRIDVRESLQKTFGLAASPDQGRRIDEALRTREQEWAEIRLVAKTGEKALRSLTETLNSWGRDSVNLELDELPPQTQAPSRLVEYLNSRLGTSATED